MKVALISDSHGMLPPVAQFSGADFVLHAGDIGPDVEPLEWFSEVFCPWAEELGIPIYMTWGNHDFIGERFDIKLNLPSNVSIHVDEQVEIAGKKVWFSPWSNLFGDWAFMKPESGLAKVYAQIPDDTDVIVSHGPPQGLGDEIFWDGGYQHVGSKNLLARLKSLPKVSLVVCGHIHEARGYYGLDEREVAENDELIDVWNASLVNQRYQPVHKPIIIDFM